MEVNYEKIVKPNALYGPYGKGGVVKGFVGSSEWEEVVSAFEDNFALNLELGSQLSIYWKGENVVELFGYSSTQKNYDGRTLQNIFSSGKNMEAICIALLVDRGLLAYEDRVTKHWPEFGQHGKDSITIADILRHEGGLPFFGNSKEMDKPRSDRRLTNQEILDWEPVEEIIANAGLYRDKVGASVANAESESDIETEKQLALDMASSNRHYHSTTRGWVLSAIIRRVDPQRRTLGQFMHDEVCQSVHRRSPESAQPGTGADRLNLDIFCGMSPELQRQFNFAEITMINHSYLATHEVIPGRIAKALPTGKAFDWLRSLILKPTTPATQGMIDTFWSKMGMVRRHNSAKFLNKLPGYMNTEEGRTLECPSVTIQANAASLGKLAGLLATGGTLAGHNGTPLLSSNAIKLALSEPKYAYDHYMKCHNSYTKGGFCDFSTFDASRSHIVHPQFHEHMRGFYGWGGLGGSFFIFHPEKQVGLAYAMNGMALCSLGGPRTDRIMKACQKVLKLL